MQEHKMEQSIRQIQNDALKDLETATDAKAVTAISIRYLGRKGKVTQLLRSIADLSPDQRAAAGGK